MGRRRVVGRPTFGGFALVPFLSQRGIIRAGQLMGQDAGSNVATYDERMRQMVSALCAPFADDAVDVVAAHCIVTGASLGGGERAAKDLHRLRDRRWALPPHAHYVMLGHFHHTQQSAGAAPIWYSASPLQVDFGEMGGPRTLVVTADRNSPPVVGRLRCRVDVACARCGARSISCPPRPRTTATRFSASTSRGR